MEAMWPQPAEPGQITPTKSAASRRKAAKEPKKPGEVPKVAPGQENAVTQRLLKTKMCYFFERGKCASKTCRYAHSVNELRKQPDLQKTKLCKAYAEGYCTRGDDCVYAHGEVQLRVTDGIYKTQMCHFFERGRCLKGERCNHAHGPEDLRRPLQQREEDIPSVPMALGTPVATPGKAMPNRPSPGLADLTQGRPQEVPTTMQAVASIAAAAAVHVQASQAAALNMCTPPHELSSAWGMPWAAYGGISTPESYYLGPSPQLPSMLPQDVGSRYLEAWSSEVQPCDLNERLDSMAGPCPDPADSKGTAAVQAPFAAEEPAQRRIHRI